MISYFKTIILLSLICYTSQVTGQDLRLFPNYDQIVHYHLEFPERETHYKTEQELDSMFRDYGGYIVTKGFNGDMSENIEVTLIDNGFTKTILNKKKCRLIDSVFVQKPMPNSIFFQEATLPAYLDYFVFKINKNVVGIIQIAPNNSDFRLFGNVMEQEGFGENFEIGKFLTAFRKL